MGRTQRSTKSVPVALGGEAWKVVFARLPDGKNGHWGWCHHDRKELEIDPRVFDEAITAQYVDNVSPRQIILHEAIHAACPYLSEPVVDRLSIELDELLDAVDL
jgi:hypothetical protein